MISITFRTRKAKLIREIILGIGPTVEYDQVLRRLRDHQQDISTQMFNVYRKIIFPTVDFRTRKGGTTPVTQEPLAVIDPPPKPANGHHHKENDLGDYLVKLARFSSIVHDLGGVDKARGMLDDIERMVRRQ